MLPGAQQIHAKFPWIKQVADRRKAEEVDKLRRLMEQFKVPDGYRLLPKNTTILDCDLVYFGKGEWIPSNPLCKSAYYMDGEPHARPDYPATVKANSWSEWLVTGLCYDALDFLGDKIGIFEEHLLLKSMSHPEYTGKISTRQVMENLKTHF